MSFQISFNLIYATECNQERHVSFGRQQRLHYTVLQNENSLLRTLFITFCQPFSQLEQSTEQARDNLLKSG